MRRYTYGHYIRTLLLSTTHTLYITKRNHKEFNYLCFQSLSPHCLSMVVYSIKTLLRFVHSVSFLVLPPTAVLCMGAALMGYPNTAVHVHVPLSSPGQLTPHTKKSSSTTNNNLSHISAARMQEDLINTHAGQPNGELYSISTAAVSYTHLTLPTKRIV